MLWINRFNGSEHCFQTFTSNVSDIRNDIWHLYGQDINLCVPDLSTKKNKEEISGFVEKTFHLQLQQKTAGTKCLDSSLS